MTVANGQCSSFVRVASQAEVPRRGDGRGFLEGLQSRRCGGLLFRWLPAPARPAVSALSRTRLERPQGRPLASASVQGAGARYGADMSNGWDSLGSKRARLVIAALSLAALGAIGADLASRRLSPGHRMAVQIAQGFVLPADPDGDLTSDEKLTRDANEAGYRWAERRSADRPEACQPLTADFRKGCLDYVKERAR